MTDRFILAFLRENTQGKQQQQQHIIKTMLLGHIVEYIDTLHFPHQTKVFTKQLRSDDLQCRTVNIFIVSSWWRLHRVCFWVKIRGCEGRVAGLCSANSRPSLQHRYWFWFLFRPSVIPTSLFSCVYSFPLANAPSWNWGIKLLKYALEEEGARGRSVCTHAHTHK